MGKTTNILDLNNRLEKVEKEKVAQNNYNSLKNRPKINGNLLTGDKTGAQLGLADVQDIGDISELETTATNLVGAVNEVNGLINNVNYINLTFTSSETTAIGKLRDIVNQFLPDVKAYTNIINVNKANDAPYATVIYSGNAGNPSLYGMGIAISYYLDHAYIITNSNGTVTIKQLSEAS